MFAGASLLRRMALAGSARALSSAPAASGSTAGPSQTPDFRDHLRTATRRRLCCPAEPLPRNLFYERLVSPNRLVDEFFFLKTSRRQARLYAALRFLRRHNVLMHGLLFYSPQTATWNTTEEFARLALFGESVIHAEVRGRLLRLFPDMSHDGYAACVAELASRRALAALFDALRMEQLVGSPSPPRQVRREGGRRRAAEAVSPKARPSEEEKCAMVCAVVGEMQWFAARTKATDRTHNNALFPPSDVLILHVLCTHLLESVPAELIYAEVEPVLEDARRVWVNEPMSLPSQLRLRPRTVSALSLAAAPHAPSEEELARRSAASATGAVTPPRPLTAAPDAQYIRSTMRPAVSFAAFDSDGGRWYSVLPTDRRGKAPALTPEPALAPPTRTVISEERVAELTAPPSPEDAEDRSQGSQSA